MQEKGKRVVGVLALIGLILVGLVMMWIVYRMVNMGFGNNQVINYGENDMTDVTNIVEDEGEKTDLLADLPKGEIKGVVESISIDEIVLQMDGESKNYKINENTLYKMFDSLIRGMVDIKMDNITIGTNAGLVLDDSDKNLVAEVLVYPKVEMRGTIQSIEDNIINMKNFLDEEDYILRMADGFVAFDSMGNKVQWYDLVEGKNIILTSNNEITENIVYVNWMKIIN